MLRLGFFPSLFWDGQIGCKLWGLLCFQAEKVHELNEEIGKLLAKAEQLGAEGNVDEAQKVLQEVEKVRTKKKDAEVRRECWWRATEDVLIIFILVTPAFSSFLI